MLRRRVRPVGGAEEAERRQWERGVLDRPVLPVSTAGLLDLGQGCDVVVLDGRVLQVLWRVPKAGERVVEINRCRRAVRP